MKLAFILNSISHFEVVPLLVELFNDDEIDIWYRKDTYGWLSYVKTLKAIRTFKYDNLAMQFYTPMIDYDKVILMTSHDFRNDSDSREFLANLDCKVASILHLDNEHAQQLPMWQNIDMEPYYIDEYITLSPYVKPKHKPYQYFMSTHKGMSHTHTRTHNTHKKNIVAYVGHAEEGEIDTDFLTFMENNPDFQFNLCLSQFTKQIPSKYDLPNNVHIFQGINTISLMKKLAQCKYIMCRKTPYQKEDRFTGSIALCLSTDCIPIIQAGFAADYNLTHALTFKAQYCELLNVNLEEYFNDESLNWNKTCRGALTLNNIKLKKSRPKRIWQLYDDTNKVDPYAMAYLQCKNPKYEYNLMNFENALHMIKPYFPVRYPFIEALVGSLKPAHASDVLRMCLLYAFGGVYLDVDLKPLVSFDSFPEDVSVVTCFGQDNPLSEYKGRIDAKPTAELMATGFLMSHPNVPLILDWLDMMLNFRAKDWCSHGTCMYRQFALLKNRCQIPLLGYNKLPLSDGHKVYVIRESATLSAQTLKFNMVNIRGNTIIQSNGHNYGTIKPEAVDLHIDQVYNYLGNALSHYYTDEQFTAAYGRLPKMRDHTFKLCLEHLKVNDSVVELGTSRSFLDGRFPNWEKNDAKYWNLGEPDKWDWSAGMFSWFFSKFANVNLNTVDIDKMAIEKCKIMTAGHKNIKYHISDSVRFIKRLQRESVDLMYLDTGNIDPVEPTATLHLNEAKAIISSACLKKGGWLLIDDCRNPCMFVRGNPDHHEFAKARYSIPYLMENGFKLIANEYQIILEKV